jgi:site-specific DNA recombinase
MLKVLNAEGRTTKKGSKFKKTSFNSILQQEKYKGTFVWNKSVSKDVLGNYNSHEYKPVEEQVRIEGGCEAIIEPELFDRVQEKMKNNRNSNKRSSGNHHYMLGGMGKIYCSECNSLMVGASYKSHGKNYRYYACPNHKEKVCTTKNIRAQYIEKIVCVYITKLLLTKENICKYNSLLQQISSSKSISGLNKELSGITTAINNILKTIEIHPTIEATERLFSLSNQKAEIEKKILAINETPKISESNFKMIRNEFAKTLKTSPDPTIYDILNYAIKKITVSNDDVEIELNI